MPAIGRTRRIEAIENQTARIIDIIRAVEVLAALAETDEERAALVLILQGASRLKELAIQQRRQA